MIDPIIFSPRNIPSEGKTWILFFLTIGILSWLFLPTGKPFMVALGSEIFVLILYLQIKRNTQILIYLSEKKLVYEYLNVWDKPGSIVIDLSTAKAHYWHGKIRSGEWGRIMTLKDKNTRKKITLSEANYFQFQLNEIKKNVEHCRNT
jgi:hypothetical protein